VHSSPPAPAGSSACSTSGTTASSSGQGGGDPTRYYVTGSAELALNLSRASLRFSPGFAGYVIGGAEDPADSPD
jgi:hypothetical protein